MITSLTLQTLSTGSYQLLWTSDLAGAVFFVYRDGILIATTSNTTLRVSAPAGSSPVFEVLDDPAAKPTQVFPAYVLLAWNASIATATYLVEQFIGAAWVQRTKITDNGAGYFTFNSGKLLDSTSYQFRVTPIGVNGNAGTAKVFNFLMVRNPDPPAVNYSYASGNLTVA